MSTENAALKLTEMAMAIYNTTDLSLAEAVEDVEDVYTYFAEVVEDLSEGFICECCEEEADDEFGTIELRESGICDDDCEHCSEFRNCLDELFSIDLGNVFGRSHRI